MVPFSLLLPAGGPILPRRAHPRAGAARALGDDGLLLDFELLVDVLAVDAQLAGAFAVGAALAAHQLPHVVLAGPFMAGFTHGALLVVSWTVLRKAGKKKPRRGGASTRVRNGSRPAPG